MKKEILLCASLVISSLSLSQNIFASSLPIMPFTLKGHIEPVDNYQVKVDNKFVDRIDDIIKLQPGETNAKQHTIALYNGDNELNPDNYSVLIDGALEKEKKSKDEQLSAKMESIIQVMLRKIHIIRTIINASKDATAGDHDFPDSEITFTLNK